MSAFLAKFYQVIICILLFLLLGAVAIGGVQTFRLAKAQNKILNAEITCQDKINKKLKPYLDAEKEAQETANQAGEQYEESKEVERVKTKTITREVQTVKERPVYINTCIDDDGVRLINEAGNTG